MPWLPSPSQVRAKLGHGLVGEYRVRDGRLVFETPRPGSGWHGHGWRPRAALALVDGKLAAFVVWRHRWRLRGTTTTRQDRAPDEVDGLRAVAFVIFLRLWARLSATRGVHHHDEVVPALDRTHSRRTVERWLHRLLPAGLRLQQALRTTLIERHEPRAIERLFPGGLSPPGRLRSGWWKDPSATYSLATALAFLFGGAVALDTPEISATVLLLEARRRLDGPLSRTGF